MAYIKASTYMFVYLNSSKTSSKSKQAFYILVENVKKQYMEIYYLYLPTKSGISNAYISTCLKCFKISAKISNDVYTIKPITLAL